MEALGTASHNGLFSTGGRYESAGPRSRFDNFHSKQQQQQQQSSGEGYFVNQETNSFNIFATTSEENCHSSFVGYLNFLG
jgi:hypothetical protein